MQYDLDLAYLMCSRLCHDLAAPLSAISIGLDMLPEVEDPDDPQAILRYSVKSAMNKLELLRCLGGYTSSPEKPTFTDAVRIINKSVDSDKYTIDWRCPIEDSLSGSAVRLIVAIISIALDALPRGGNITIHPDFSIELSGPYVKLSDEVGHALTGKIDSKALSSREIIGHLAYLLSRSLGTQINHQAPQDRKIVFKLT